MTLKELGYASVNITPVEAKILLKALDLFENQVYEASEALTTRINYLRYVFGEVSDGEEPEDINGPA